MGKTVRNLLLEKNVPLDKAAIKRMKDRPYYAFLYAKNILNDRLPPKLEEVFAKDPQSAYLYAKHIIKGRLPDFVHNALIIGGFTDPESKKFISDYLKQFCKN
jgi:hypothetical protein